MVTGWRCWVIDHGGVLVGPWSKEPWPTPTVAARCDYSDGMHAAPHGPCECGLRALPDLAELLRIIRESPWPGRGFMWFAATGVLVIGRVNLSGWIIGRSERDRCDARRGAFAELVAPLYVEPGPVAVAAALQQRYGVEVIHCEPGVTRRDWLELLEQHVSPC